MQRVDLCDLVDVLQPFCCEKVSNPCPRVKHPDWLRKIVREINDGYRQTKIDQLFKAAPAGTPKVCGCLWLPSLLWNIVFFFRKKS